MKSFSLNRRKPLHFENPHHFLWADFNKTMNSRERMLAVLDGKTVDRTPVFPLLMSFSARRLGVSYREFASDGLVMGEAQIKVREMFGVDAITACSDAFRISADLGGEMEFPEDTPPHMLKPLVASMADLKALRRPDPARAGSRMADRARGVGEMVRTVGKECLVLGWVDLPFAEACSVCGVSEFLMMIYDEPELAHALLAFLTGIVTDFCLLQLAEGAPMIGAGDAAASLISPELYREFALPYEQQVIESVHAAGGRVKLHICGNTSALLPDMIRSGADLFNVDHLVNFQHACEIYGGARLCFKGNLDPVAELFQGTPEKVKQSAARCLQQARGLPYVLSAGCEVPGETSDETFRAFCESVL